MHLLFWMFYKYSLIACMAIVCLYLNNFCILQVVIFISSCLSGIRVSLMSVLLLLSLCSLKLLLTFSHIRTEPLICLVFWVRQNPSRWNLCPFVAFCVCLMEISDNTLAHKVAAIGCIERLWALSFQHHGERPCPLRTRCKCSVCTRVYVVVCVSMRLLSEGTQVSTHGSEHQTVIEIIEWFLNEASSNPFSSCSCVYMCTLVA